MSMLLFQTTVKKVVFFSFAIACSMNLVSAMTDEKPVLSNGERAKTLPANWMFHEGHERTERSEDALRTRLHEAAEDGNISVVTKLLEEKDVAIDAEDGSGYTAAELACFNRHGAVVEILVDAGASITRRNQRDGTLLHTTAAHGLHKAVGKICKKHGDKIADFVNQEDKSGTTSVEYSSPMRYAIKEYLSTQEIDEDNQAVGDEFVATMLILIQCGAVVTDKSGNNQSESLKGIFDASRQDDGTFYHPNIVDYLLDLFPSQQ